MAKENLTVTIEENLLQKSKEVIPNLSQFFEECLAKRIGWGEDAMFPIHSAEEELDKIGTSMVNLHLMTEKQNIQNKEIELQEQKKDRVWRTIFSEYRTNENIQLSQLHEASELLDVTSEVLADVLYVNASYVPREEMYKCNEWKWSYNKYVEYVDGDD